MKKYIVIKCEDAEQHLNDYGRKDIFADAVKSILKEKNIDLYTCTPEYIAEAAFYNLRNALTKDMPMTQSQFKIWCRELGVKANLSLNYESECEEAE